MEEKNKKNKTQWEVIKIRIYNAYHQHWKILLLIFIFYLILLNLIWKSPSLETSNLQNGGDNNLTNKMGNIAEQINPTGTVKKQRATGRAIKALGSPFETTFNALWWVLSQLGTLISIILILIIVPSVPIILYAGALYMVISILLNKVKKI